MAALSAESIAQVRWTYQTAHEDVAQLFHVQLMVKIKLACITEFAVKIGFVPIVRMMLVLSGDHLQLTATAKTKVS